MKNPFHKVRHLTNYVAAAIAVGAILPEEANASGGGTVGSIAEGLIQQVGTVGKVVTAGAVVAGLVMLITGLIKLKQAAETQGQQVKYSEGLWRCVIGAGLIAVPALNGVLGTTFGITSGTPTITSGGSATF